MKGKQALISCFSWCVCWLLTFWLSSVAIIHLAHKYAQNVASNYTVDVNAIASITVLGLTISVIAGHVPKLVSYMYKCDTDFKIVENKDKIKRYRAGARACLSLLFLFCAVASIFVMHYFVYGANSPQDFNAPFNFVSTPTTPVNWVDMSFKYGFAILFLVLAQLTFSWPDEMDPSVLRSTTLATN